MMNMGKPLELLITWFKQNENIGKELFLRISKQNLSGRFLTISLGFCFQLSEVINRGVKYLKLRITCRISWNLSGGLGEKKTVRNARKAILCSKCGKTSSVIKIHNSPYYRIIITNLLYILTLSSFYRFFILVTHPAASKKCRDGEILISGSFITISQEKW